MTSLTNEIKDKYPKQHEIDAIMLKARIMRARAMRDVAVRFWSMLQRNVRRSAGTNTHVEA
jgi:hypothetical protein